MGIKVSHTDNSKKNTYRSKESVDINLTTDRSLFEKRNSLFSSTDSKEPDNVSPLMSRDRLNKNLDNNYTLSSI